MFDFSKLSSNEREVILDAIDLFGFEAVAYISASDMYCVLFATEEFDLKDGDSAVDFLNKQTSNKKWCHMTYDNERVLGTKYNFDSVMNYFGWGDEIK